MSERRRVWLLIAILVGTAFIIGAVSIILLYRAALAEERARLTETAQRQARLLEAVARFDAEQSTDYPGGAVQATLSQIRESHANYEGFGNTGEFTLAEEQDGQIVFLLSHRHGDTDVPQPVPIAGERAEPMRQALAGRSGTIIGLDYRGEKVLAAYEPVEGLGWGIVAKIDLVEIRAPFNRAALISGGVALVVVAFGTLLFFKLTNPLIDSLAESREYFRTTLYSIGDAVLVTDAEGRVQQMNPVAEALTGWSESDARGKPVSDVFRIINEETRAEVENPVQRVLREGKVVGLANHTLLVARDGKQLPIADSGAPIQTRAGEIRGAVLVFRDQTEERAARRALRESEEKYRLLFENVMNGFALHEIIVDEDGEPVDYVFLEVNRAFEKTTGGLKKEDLIGKRVTDVLPGIEDDPTDWIGRFGKVALTGEDTQFVAYLQPLGRRYSVMAFRPRKGQFASIFEDVTERKQAEEALAKSEERYRDIIENLPGVVYQFVMDFTSGEFYFENAVVNDYAARRSGITESTLLNNIPAYINSIVPEDFARFTQVMEQSAREMTPYSIEYRIRRPSDGEIFWLSARATPRRLSENKVMWTGIAIDVTDRKRIEAELNREHQRLERLMATSPVAITMVDPQGQITFANREAEQLLRLDKDALAQRTYNSPDWQITDFEGNPYPDEKLPFVMVKETLQSVRDVQHAIKLPDTEQIYLSINAAPLIDEDGEFEGMVSALDDITEQIAAEEALRESEERLRFVMRASGVVFATVDRDLRYTWVYNPHPAFDEEGAIGKRDDELVDDPAHVEGIMAIKRDVLATGKRVQREFKIHLPDGVHWHDFVAEPILDESGEVAGMTTAGVDITALKTSEQELRRTRNLLQRTFDALDDAVFIIDPEKPRQIFACNQAVERIFGYQPEELTGGTTRILHVDEAHYQTFGEEGNSILEETGRYHTEYVMQRKDGTRIITDNTVVTIEMGEGVSSGAVSVVRDITAQKQAEQDLRHSEARLAAFVEAMPDLGFILNREGRYIDVLGSQEDLLANSAERLKGSLLHDMMPSDVADKCLETVRQTLDTGQTQSVEYELDVPAGHRWFEARSAPKFIAGSETDNVVFLVRDITERQETYEEIKQQAAYLRALNQSSRRVSRWGLEPEGVLRAIASSLVEEIGIAFARIWTIDKSGEELVLRASAGLYTHLDGERARINLNEQPGKMGEIVRSRQSILTNQVQEEEGFDHTWAREQGIVAFAGYPLVKEDQLQAVLVVFHTQPLPPVALDMLGSFANQAAIALENAILYEELESYSKSLEQAVDDRTADLRQTTERVETILHHSPDAILLLTPEGDIKQVNPAFHTMLGYGKDDVQTLTVDDLVTDDMQTSLRRTLRLTQEEFQTLRLVATVQRQDRTTFDAEIALAPILENSTLLGTVCIIHDISEMKDLERLKDQFLSTAAHELRTPLVSVQGFSEILLTRELEEERQHRYLTMINQQATQLAQIIDDLLDVSRLEAGRELDIQKEKVIIDDLLREALEPYRETSPEHTILFEPVDENVEVSADPFRLMQAIRNLLSNAVKYSPDGGTITVQSRRLPDYLLVSVSDEGIGMTPKEMENLFEPFWRADVAEKVAGGTGLGLRICQLIIAGHGGGIWAESTLGEGTTFYFTLPLNDTEQEKKA